MKQMCLSLVDVVILNPGNTVSKHRITRLSESQSSNYIQLRIPKYWEDSFLILKSSEKNMTTISVQVTGCYQSEVNILNHLYPIITSTIVHWPMVAKKPLPSCNQKWQWNISTHWKVDHGTRISRCSIFHPYAQEHQLPTAHVPSPNKWRFPELGVPPVLIHSRLGFSMK